jgi:hypothetical protein
MPNAGTPQKLVSVTQKIRGGGKGPVGSGSKTGCEFVGIVTATALIHCRAGNVGVVGESE